MLNLRTIVAGAAVLAAAVTAAQAQGYKATYPELVFAKVPDENASGTSDRWILGQWVTRRVRPGFRPTRAP